MIGMLLCVWLLAACDNSNAFDEYAKFDTTAQTAWGQSIVDGSNGYVAHVKSDRAYNLADGVDVLEMAFLADDGLAMQMFLFRIAFERQNHPAHDARQRQGRGGHRTDDYEAARGDAEEREEGLGRYERRLLQYDDLHSLRRVLPRRCGGEDFVQPYGLQRLRDLEGQHGLLLHGGGVRSRQGHRPRGGSAAAARCC